MKTTLLKILTITCANLLVFNAQGTQQIPDKLAYEGKTSELVVCGGNYHGMERDFFLERYFEKGHPKSDDVFGYGSTGCYRGYIATWKLLGNNLYLSKLERESYSDELGKTIPLAIAVPNATNQVFASWVTAQIRIPRGRELPFRHDGSGSDHELDLYVNLTNGVVESTFEVENIGKLAMLSLEHLQWRYSKGAPIEETESYLWDDARDVATAVFYEKHIKYDHNLRTRGFIHDINNGEGWLYVSGTRLTPYVSFLLHDIPKDFTVANGVPVEIKAKFIPDEYHSENLKVESIRLLKPGEAIHHPRFKLPMYQIGL